MNTFKTWKVLPDDAGWVVTCLEEDTFESRHEKKDVAVDQAKRLAMENSPGQVVVHGVTGDVVSAIHFNGLDRGSDDMDDPSPERSAVPA